MRILIVRNNSNSQAVDASLLLATYLATQGLDYTLVDSSDLSCRCDHEELNGALASGVEMAVVLGGDGTILRTARQIGTSGVPILGINFGRLGFLANTGDEGVIAVVASALAGDVVAEQRTNLRIDVVCEGEPDPWGDDDEAAAHGRGRSGAHVLRAQRAGRDARRQRAHHRLLAGQSRARTSPTCAATGWCGNGHRIDGLRAVGGGPLVAPGFNGLVAVPLAPHTLHSRAIVTAANDVVEMDLSLNRDPREAALFADGELLSFDAPVKRVYVSRGAVPTTLLRYRHDGFYEHAAKVFF